MKAFVILALAAAVSAPAFADEYVKGYTRSNGTYVAPHYRSSPNSVQYDNYSTRGNVNPYTGERGSQRDTTYDFKPYDSSRRDSHSSDD